MLTLTGDVRAESLCGQKFLHLMVFSHLWFICSGPNRWMTWRDSLHFPHAWFDFMKMSSEANSVNKKPRESCCCSQVTKSRGVFGGLEKGVCFLPGCVRLFKMDLQHLHHGLIATIIWMRYQVKCCLTSRRGDVLPLVGSQGDSSTYGADTTTS